MERRSDKHSPHLDDEMKKETESLVDGAPTEARTDEAREKEGPGEDEHTPDARLTGDRGLTPEGALDPDEANARAELASFITAAHFPADRGELLAAAKAANAPAPVIDQLRSLPEGQRFENVQAVWDAMGGTVESVRA